MAQHGDKRALVKLTTSDKGIPLDDEKVSKFRPFVETKDDKGNPITYGEKFRPNKRKKDLTGRDLKKISKACFQGNSRLAKENRNKVREMKGKKPK